jgi:cytidine deaminase
VTTIDWDQLRDAAREASARAYVPYSHYPVGAAALTETGQVVSGANVENASYGLTLCAECAVVSKLHTDGLGSRLLALACVDGNGEVLTPCGRCRQLLFEHGGGDMLIDHAGGPVKVSYLLPDAFGPDHLEAARG